MTDPEWLACDDLLVLLRSWRGDSGRKYRLFAAACARDHLAQGIPAEELALPPEYRFETAILKAEAFADGRGEIKHSRGWNVALPLGEYCDDKDVAYAALGFDADSGNWSGRPEEVVPRHVQTYRTHPALFVRDLVGPPFREVLFDPCLLAWNDGAVRRMAQAIYDERHLPCGQLDSSRLGILADALLDAGCADDAILAHLRSVGPHVRGCWALDLCLGLS